ncbi:GNAT family N-acetyltransferase [Plantibacter flavus]|uniref:GNAT family N-acetyltransferase n=1 Tax=Plantibacter flavus TaxID=150123 RepID=UPI003F16EDD9
MLPAPTSRLRFREMTLADLDAMAALLGDPEAMAALLGDPEAMAFYPAPKTREQAAAWIAWNEDNYARYGFGLWIIETLDGEFVGDCGLTWQQVNGVSSLEVGYHVTIAHQGRGFATEAAAACRDFARDHAGASELVAIINPDNIASQRIAENIGLRRVEDDRGSDGSIRWVFSARL